MTSIESGERFGQRVIEINVKAKNSLEKNWNKHE